MNTKNRTNWSFLAIGVLLSTFAFSANAHDSNRLAEKLDLSEAQQQSLATLRAEFAPIRETAQTQRKEVRAMLKTGDVEKAATLAADQARERVYQQAERLRRMAEILTPEQLAKMEEIRSNQSESRFKGQRRGRGRSE